MKPSRIARIGAFLFGLFACGMSSATAGTPLELKGLVITLPDWVTYYAYGKHGKLKSPDGTINDLANGIVLAAAAQDGDAKLSISISRDNSFESVVAPPRDVVDFTLEKFGQAFERKARRDAPGENGTVQRVSLTQRIQNRVTTIDHEYLLQDASAKSMRSVYRHVVFLFLDDGVRILQIQYPVAMQGRWGSEMKAVAESFQPAS